MSSSIFDEVDDENNVSVWCVTADPVNGNTEGTTDRKNEGGVVVNLTNGVLTREVSRVAYKRRHGTERRRFKDQLRLEVATAQDAADVMNDLERRARDVVRDARLTEREAQKTHQRAYDDRLAANRRAEQLVREARDRLNAAAAAHEKSADLR